MNELFESSYLSIMSAENDRLRKQLQQKENIIKEVREYCENNVEYADRLNDVLEIIDKENK